MNPAALQTRVRLERLFSGDRSGGAPARSCYATRRFLSLNPGNYSPWCSVNTRVIAGCWNRQRLSEEN